MRWLMPPRLFVACALSMIALWRLLPLSALIGWPLTLAGLPLLLGGLGLSVAGSRRFASSGANIQTFEEPTRLVADGLFRFSRNPMYLGFAAALFGLAVLLGALSPFAVAAGFVVIVDRWYIRFEERRMAAGFGAAYAAYRRQVRRWL
ncbi:MAG TPA: methyltransferase [Herpetosiphonaceae bacterium]